MIFLTRGKERGDLASLEQEKGRSEGRRERQSREKRGKEISYIDI